MTGKSPVEALKEGARRLRGGQLLAGRVEAENGPPPAPRVLARDPWLGGLPDGVGASSAPKLPKNSKQPPTTRAGRTSIKPLNALASSCKVEGWIWFLSFKYGGEITDSWVSPCVCIYMYVFFWTAQTTDGQTARPADADTQTRRQRHTDGMRQDEKRRQGRAEEQREEKKRSESEERWRRWGWVKGSSYLELGSSSLIRGRLTTITR